MLRIARTGLLFAWFYSCALNAARGTGTSAQAADTSMRTTIPRMSEWSERRLIVKYSTKAPYARSLGTTIDTVDVEDGETVQEAFSRLEALDCTCLTQHAFLARINMKK